MSVLSEGQLAKKTIVDILHQAKICDRDFAIEHHLEIDILIIQLEQILADLQNCILTNNEKQLKISIYDSRILSKELLKLLEK